MKKVHAGEMYGFQIVNIFPDTCKDEEWTEFADSMSKILKGTEIKEKEAIAAAMA